MDRRVPAPGGAAACGPCHFSPFRVARYSSRSAASWAVRPASCPSGISEVRDGFNSSTSLRRQDDLLVLAVSQHHLLLVPPHQQTAERPAVHGAGDVGCVLRLDPARRLQDALQQVLPRAEPSRWSISSGPTRRAPVADLVATAAVDRLRPEQRSRRDRRRPSGPRWPGAGGSSRASRPRLVRGQIALEQVADRTGRELGRRGQQRGPRSAGSSSPRPSLRAAASADLGSASSLSGGPPSGTGPAFGAPPSMPGDPLLRSASTPPRPAARSRCAASGRGRTWPCGNTGCWRTGRPA